MGHQFTPINVGSRFDGILSVYSRVYLLRGLMYPAHHVDPDMKMIHWIVHQRDDDKPLSLEIDPIET